MVMRALPEAEQPVLDAIDRRILTELQANGRTECFRVKTRISFSQCVRRVHTV